MCPCPPTNPHIIFKKLLWIPFPWGKHLQYRLKRPRAGVHGCVSVFQYPCGGIAPPRLPVEKPRPPILLLLVLTRNGVLVDARGHAKQTLVLPFCRFAHPKFRPVLALHAKTHLGLPLNRQEDEPSHQDHARCRCYRYIPQMLAGSATTASCTAVCYVKRHGPSRQRFRQAACSVAVVCLDA